MKNLAYLSLGSNLGDRAKNLREAIAGLQGLGAIKAISSLYETEPVEVMQEQPWFLNCAVALETQLSPLQLLAGTLALEQSMGRRRTQLKAPRIIDIDIVLFGAQVVREAGLSVPHPGMQARRFVLKPLAEIAPEIDHPLLNRNVRELLAALPPEKGVVRLFASGWFTMG